MEPEEEETILALLDQLIEPKRQKVEHRRVRFAEGREIQYVPKREPLIQEPWTQGVEWRKLRFGSIPRNVAERCLKTIMRAYNIWTLDDLISREADLPEEDKQLLQNCIEFLDSLTPVVAIEDEDARFQASLELLARTMPEDQRIRLKQLRQESLEQRERKRAVTLAALRPRPLQQFVGAPVGTTFTFGRRAPVFAKPHLQPLIRAEPITFPFKAPEGRISPFPASPLELEEWRLLTSPPPPTRPIRARQGKEQQ